MVVLSSFPHRIKMYWHNFTGTAFCQLEWYREWPKCSFLAIMREIDDASSNIAWKRNHIMCAWCRKMCRLYRLLDCYYREEYDLREISWCLISLGHPQEHKFNMYTKTANSMQNGSWWSVITMHTTKHWWRVYLVPS